jgi:glycosyltransferase involved in cell wall biosynthesis
MTDNIQNTTETKMNKVSVVIPTKDRSKELIDCLSSIRIQTIKPYEIIIVDSTVGDHIEKQVESFEDLPIRYIKSNPGANLQRNIGESKAQGNIILFSDDDTIWEQECLEKLIEVFDVESKKGIKIGAISGHPILDSQSSIRKFFLMINNSISKVFMLGKPGDGKFRLSGRPETNRIGEDKIIKCEFIYGFYFAIYKNVYQNFKYDENFGRYGWNEEDDIAFRLTKENYINYYTPFARLKHTMPERLNRNTSWGAFKIKVKYHKYFFDKNIEKDLKHTFVFYWSVIGMFIQDSLLNIKIRLTRKCLSS